MKPGSAQKISPPVAVTRDELVAMALEAGADDAAVVAVARVPSESRHVEDALPGATSLLSFVVRMNRGNLQSVARGAANLEFHQAGDVVNQAGRKIAARLERMGHRAFYGPMGFPNEMDNFPGRIWSISHKPVAEAAGLGKMGVHRNLIHPRFGNFILLGTVATTAEVESLDEPLNYNPCMDCKLCVAACPVGAIKSNGQFDFSACYTHNYRDFMGGFNDWIETVADAKNGLDLRKKVGDKDNAMVWQSLSFGANYKAAYCLAVCPAGDDILQGWLSDKGAYNRRVLKPLLERKEDVYVVPGSDAEVFVQKYPRNKTIRHVRNSLRPQSIAAFIKDMPLVFQHERAKVVDVVGHFRFKGQEEVGITVTIKNGQLFVVHGLKGESHFRVTVDSQTWLSIINKEKSRVPAILTGRLRVKGSLKKLSEYESCFAT